MDTTTYRQRRADLRDQVDDGAILLLGNAEASRNYADNRYRFRQDSHVLYYSGVGRPQVAVLIHPDGREVLYGPAEDPDDLIWHGPEPTLADLAAEAGIAETGSRETLGDDLARLAGGGVVVHYLPPYRADRQLELARLLDLDPVEASTAASTLLVRVIAHQRSVKTDVEVEEIEEALGVTAEGYRRAMAATAAGRTEAEIAAELQTPALARFRQQAFLPIVSVRGEVLHNEVPRNTLRKGQMMLIDSGAESPAFYASDITRTFPVTGRFDARQRDVYEVVLRAQKDAIRAASPAVTNRELHLKAARVIAEGLADVGLMRGDLDAAVESGAHALFFPHGLGHMLGLDVHDMEDLGDVVGYDPDERRSEQFGLAALRLARRLEPGFVITVEPGVYFIPALIDRWRAERRHAEFIAYDRLDEWSDFGGIRIEDDVLITAAGSRVLGPGIPKEVDEVEAAVGG